MHQLTSLPDLLSLYRSDGRNVRHRVSGVCVHIIKLTTALLLVLLNKVSVSQDTLRYLCSDTLHVRGMLSQDWPDQPSDSIWICPGLYVFDASVSFHYPTVTEVYSTDSIRLLLGRETIYRDSLVSTAYHPNGALKSRKVIGRPIPIELSTKLFYPNGQLRYSMRYDLDTLQLSTTYYSNGKKQLEYWWYDWRPYNEWTEWYEDGRPRLRGQYERWPLDHGNKEREPRKVGKWYYFRPDGELEKVEVYNQGKLIKTRTK